MNPHSFISITSSIQQIYTIARELGQIDPANKAYYNKNAQAYAQKLRNMKASCHNKSKSPEKSEYESSDFTCRL